MTSPYDCFSINSESSFREHALHVFRHQATHVKVYAEFLRAIGVDASSVNRWEEIPHLPIELFKTHRVLDRETPVALEFRSSGTTGQQVSLHAVADPRLYEASFLKAFERFYGHPSRYCFLALLPSYLEREGSSLVYMAGQLIRLSGHEDSGFYLYDHASLTGVLRRLTAEGQPAVLLGVTYALIDLAQSFPGSYSGLVVMETGGMKGRRKEIIRDELHSELCSLLGVDSIHSEYGMTELFSQAYSQGNGRFHCPPWMRVRIRELDDPFSYAAEGRTGGINITDLANFHSCSFISTQDLGRDLGQGVFEVMGRFDDADVRGCNLMIP